MSYYDIDDILAEGVKIPCKCNITIPNLGYLINQPMKPLKKNVKLELPMWLSIILAQISVNSGEDEDETLIELMVPEFFNSKILNLIKTNSSVLDLHNIQPYMILIGIKWCHIFKDVELSEILTKLIVERSIDINDYSYNINSSSNEDILLKFDNFEKAVYKLNNQQIRRFNNWLINSGST